MTWICWRLSSTHSSRCLTRCCAAAQVVAKRRVRRDDRDDQKYATMVAASSLAAGTGDTPGFVDAHPTEALCYIADDLKFAQACVEMERRTVSCLSL